MGNWRVNQTHTYRHEVGEGYLWSPKTNKDGRRNRFYDSMTEAQQETNRDADAYREQQEKRIRSMQCYSTVE